MVSTLTHALGLILLAASGTSVGPLGKGETVAWSHAPFEFGDCSICHQKNDSKSPGPINMPVNELCYSCHDQIKDGIKGHQFKHAPVEYSCVACHNPHNAKAKKLLHDNVPQLCYGCHGNIKDIVQKSPVQHGSVTADKSCLNCHTPHSSNVQKMLVQLPFDLCVNCHGQDGMKDDTGKAITNVKTLLKDNPKWHGPVAGKDCSACHTPHGGQNFRLLVSEYPAKFYAPYDPKNYALCFRCHNDQMVKDPQTTTLTNFRDGERNLHYLHVNKDERGRTCRACHDIHATKQEHQIRDGVPYGSTGWVLPLNYKKLPDGGQCAKTCHSTKVYNNKKVAAQKK